MQRSRGAVLVTGANGFVGRAVVERLRAAGIPTRAAVRGIQAPFGPDVQIVAAPDFGSPFDATSLLRGCDAVVHLAARVHVMGKTDPTGEALYHRINVAGTIELARQAIAAGVRRFVFLSSIKVNGEVTTHGLAFSADDEPRPLDAYGRSKLEAEHALFKLAASGELEVVVIRPVLVYGPGVRANFRSLLRWASRGLPLPFGAIPNRRSMVYVENLADLVVTTIDHPKAYNNVFLVSDAEDLSTTELLRRTAAAMNRRSRLIPIPAQLLQIAASALGRGDVARRLIGSLQVNTDKTQSLLGWHPPITVAEGLGRTTRWFLESIQVG